MQRISARLHDRTKETSIRQIIRGLNKIHVTNLLARYPKQGQIKCNDMNTCWTRT